MNKQVAIIVIIMNNKWITHFIILIVIDATNLAGSFMIVIVIDNTNWQLAALTTFCYRYRFR